MEKEKKDSANVGLLHRVQDLIHRKPNSYDVVFSVGPAKKEVKAVRILLEAASPVLEKEFELWGNSVVREESVKGIPLPDFDPDAFEIFVKLTMLDDWTSHQLMILKLQPGQILDLISICRVYEIKSALTNLEDLMNSFYCEFAAFKNTPDFIRLSNPNLRTILSSDNITIKETDVFKCACRWATAECVRREMDSSDDNLRLVLGDCLFEIRFPLMTPQEFTRCVNTYNILTCAEGFEIFKFISTDEMQRSELDVSLLPFKTKPRGATLQSKVERKLKPQFFKLCFTSDYPILDSPSVCDGRQRWICIATKRKILLHGLGFLGPIGEDAYYDVTVRFGNSGGDDSFAPKAIQKRIFARKDAVFRITFDQPIKLLNGSVETWTNHYWIFYFLQGPSTKSFQRTFGRLGDCTKLDGENEFRLQWRSTQLAEVVYTNV